MLNRWLLRILFGKLIVQNDIQQRLIDVNPTVVLDEPELTKSIHEKANSGAGSPDHVCQCLLRYLGDKQMRLSRLAELSHE